MPPTRAQLLTTAHAFIADYNDRTDPRATIRHRTRTCTHTMLPASQGGHVFTNEAWLALSAQVRRIFRNNTFGLYHGDEARDVLVDVEAGKVMLHVRGVAETDLGGYDNEYFFVLRMVDEEGKGEERGVLVDEVVEFVDSRYSSEFVGRLRGAGIQIG